MKKLFLSLLALILIVEEWLWDVLTIIGHHIDRLAHLDRFEEWLRQSAPRVALLAMLVPLAIVTPLNVGAVILFTHGMIWEGLLTELTAKLLGTLLVARVFALTKPQLLTFPAFAWIYTTIMRWLDWAHERIVETSLYRVAVQLKVNIRRKLQS
jgi:hypothetical protein